MQHGGGPQRKLALVVLGLGVGDPVAQMALTDGFELQWGLTTGAGHSDGVGSEIEKEFAGERVVRRVEWLESGGDVGEVVTARDTAQGDVDHSAAIFVGRAVLRRHATTLRLRRQRPHALPIASVSVGRNGIHVER